MIGCIFYVIGAFFLLGAFKLGMSESALVGIVIGILFFVLGYTITPKEFSGGHRRKNHARARILNDTQIEVTNLDDVDVWEMDRWHVSTLKVRTRIGHGTWVYTFDKPMGTMGTQSEQDMYMREAEASLNRFIDEKVNPAKDRLHEDKS